MCCVELTDPGLTVIALSIPFDHIQIKILYIQYAYANKNESFHVSVRGFIRCGESIILYRSETTETPDVLPDLGSGIRALTIRDSYSRESFSRLGGGEGRK
jgi:hypothetical protein